MNDELLRRASDLIKKAERGEVSHTAFLTPAERAVLSTHLPRGVTAVYDGGASFCERTAAFFLPDWLDEDMFSAGDYISAVYARARFAEPGHRDWLGSLIGLGIKREMLGDIICNGEECRIFAFNHIAEHIASQLIRVGRNAVRCELIRASDVPAPQVKVRKVTFTVMSARLDAVVSGMFNISRSSAAERIAMGGVKVNHIECLKPDAQIEEDAVISVRGCGKGKVLSVGGKSRKGRTFAEAEVYE